MKIVISATFLPILTFATLSLAKQGKDFIPVEVLKPHKGEHKEYTRFIGTTAADKSVQLYSYHGGQVKKLFAVAGQKVNKGDKLCDIEAEKFQLAYDIAKLNKKIAADTVARTKAHVSRGTSSRMKKDQDNLSLFNAKKAEIEAKKIYEGSLCLVPFAGIVTERQIDLYDELNPNTETFHIASLEKIIAKVEVSEQEYGSFKIGNKASLSLSPQRPAALHGEVVSLNRRANQRTKTFVMKVEFANKNKKILLNSTVYVKILKKSYRNSFVIPNNAVIIKNDKTYIYEADDNKANLKEISIGPQLEKNVVVLKGLRGDEQVIIRGGEFLKNGQNIKITKVHKNDS